ncbi:MAG: tetratricopeptide repeat protein [Thermodesulfobacteriota bacterium]
MNCYLSLYQPFGRRLRSLFRALMVPAVVTLGVGSFSGAEGLDAHSAGDVREADVSECLRKGRQALEERDDSAAAVEAFRSCVARYPKSPLGHYWLGQALFLSGQNLPAIGEIKEALRLDPDNLYAVRLLAKVYSLDKNRLSLAQELLEKVVGRNPEFQDARFDLACVYGQQGNWDRAFEQFAMLTKGERKHARYRTEIGKIFSAMGQYDDARIQFKRALALFPEYKPARDALRELDEKSDKAVNPHSEQPVGR